MSSIEWRRRGNEDFVNAKKSFLNKLDNYKKALDCYIHAVDLADNDTEYSSAAKNCGRTYMEINEYHKVMNQDKEKRISLFAGALEYFSKALSRGSGCQSSSWTNSLSQIYKKCLEDAMIFSETFPRLDQVQILQAMIKDVVDNNGDKGKFYLKAVEILKKEADCLFHENKIAEASDLLEDASKPIEKAKELGKYVINLENTITLSKLRIRARIELSKGESVLKEATNRKTTTTFHLDLLFRAIDTFSKCVELSEEAQELEIEAEAYSRLGHIYDQILHNSTRAKGYYLKCIFITDAIVPRFVWDKAWHQECIKALQKFQKQAVEDADNEAMIGKSEYLRALKDELRKLKEVAQKGCIPSLLSFITSEFPARRGNLQPFVKEDLSKLEESDLRKQAQKLAMYYHPDRQTGDDKKWKVLCEEIMKEINKVLPQLC